MRAVAITPPESFPHPSFDCRHRRALLTTASEWCLSNEIIFPRRYRVFERCGNYVTSGYDDVDTAKIDDAPAVFTGRDKPRLVRLPRIDDERGSLVAAELGQHLPFEVKRIFVVFDVPNRSIRGQHAHRELNEFIIAVGGSVTVEVDDGHAKNTFLLDSPSIGLFIPPLTWRTLTAYDASTVLIVAASHPYDANDYIRDIADFRALFSED